jgi:hypothetical protein
MSDDNKVLVLQATGKAGRNIALALKNAGFEVFGTTRSAKNNLASKGITPVIANYTVQADIERAIKESGAKKVIGITDFFKAAKSRSAVEIAHGQAQFEACKAGDAGRGFAVVAQEVRALANRSADSARKVVDIVGRSTLDIEQSHAMADETSQAMVEADGHVDAIHGAMSSVAALTQQGDRESAAILDEIKVLKDSTSKNLDLVDQLAVASDALRGQGERLSHKVGLFKLS